MEVSPKVPPASEASGRLVKIKRDWPSLTRCTAIVLQEACGGQRKETGKEALGCTHYVAGRSASSYHGIFPKEPRRARPDDLHEKYGLSGGVRGHGRRTFAEAQQRQVETWGDPADADDPSSHEPGLNSPIRERGIEDLIPKTRLTLRTVTAMEIASAVTIGIIAPSRKIQPSAETQVKIQGPRMERRRPAWST